MGLRFFGRVALAMLLVVVCAVSVMEIWMSSATSVCFPAGTELWTSAPNENNSWAQRPGCAAVSDVSVLFVEFGHYELNAAETAADVTSRLSIDRTARGLVISRRDLVVGIDRSPVATFTLIASSCALFVLYLVARARS